MRSGLRRWGGASAGPFEARGIPLVLVAIVVVQFGAAIAKGAVREIGPFGVVFWRVTIAAVLIAAVSRPRWRGRGADEWRTIVFFGIALAGMNVAYYASLQRLPIGVAVTIEFAGPLGVAVFGRWRSPIHVAAAGVAAVGVVLLSPLGGGSIDPLGALLALTAGACWAAYIVLSARVGTTFAGASGLALALGVASLLTVIPAAATSGQAMFAPKWIATGAAVAVLSSALPYALELEALRWIHPSTFGLLMSLEPASGALAGGIVLGERLGGREWAAIGIVFVANVLAAGGRRRERASVAGADGDRGGGEPAHGTVVDLDAQPGA